LTKKNLATQAHAILRTYKITRYYRIVRVILHTLVGFFIAGIVLPVSSKPHKLKLISWWCKYLLNAFNIRVTATGNVPTNPNNMYNTMVVANHISWADIHALTSILPLRFIAKFEISTWPVFGYLATKANALFIDRAKRRDAAKTVAITRQSLLSGDNICLFPEGTTTDGTEIKPFKSSLIQAAIEAKATIQPVVVRYPLSDGRANTELAYAGNTTLRESMQLALSQKYPQVHLHFLPAIPAEHYLAHYNDRRLLTEYVELLIRNAANEQRKSS
jgi:1-acyl-sn-glycerol-3-phosphate acyltransferase